MKDLSKRQAQVLAYIKKCMRDNLLPPTLREIRTELGVASVYAITNHLRALEKKGWITREFRKARCISLTEKAKGAK